MKEEDYHRLVQTSVTVFIEKDGKYLLLKRKQSKRVDPGRLNGVGGRVDPGEDYLKCCIREVAEETGYLVTTKDIAFNGILKLEGGYQEDWVIAIFKVKVASFEIPRGAETEDGELLWLDKDEVLDSKYTLVDDVNYYFKEVVTSERLFFINAKLDTNQIVQQTSATYLS
jgi:8-oxo-dGTP pyrophosphatase MutT (NUDIX family)